MDVSIFLNYNDSWTSYPLSSLIIYYTKRNIKFELILQDKVEFRNYLIIEDNFIQKTIFIDCNDSDEEIVNHGCDFYFKRSKSIFKEYKINVFPLGFTFPDYSMCSNVLRKLIFQKKYLDLIKKSKDVRVELIRSMDFYGLFTNDNFYTRNRLNWQNENSLDLLKDKFLYKTRLWNPRNVNSNFKKDQRILMNNWRINMVTFLRKNYPNDSLVGILEDEFSSQIVDKSLLIKKENFTMRNYLQDLSVCRVGVADDGLENTLGWKIGEYVYNCKPILSTPINIELPGDFGATKNYYSVNRIFDEVEVKHTCQLILENHFIQSNNYQYAKKYLYDDNLVKYIYSKIT
jgi:hypothetical protein